MSRLQRNFDGYDTNDEGSEIELSDDEEKSVPVNYANIYDKDITANFRRVLNVTTMKRIANTIENNLRRKLRQNEIESIRNMIIEDLNPAQNYRRDPTNKFYLGNLQKWDDKTIIDKIADRWIKRNNYFSKRCAPPIIDIHEVLKKEIGTTSESGTVSRPTFVEPVLEGFSGKPNKVAIKSILDASTKYQLQKLINPDSLSSYNYIYLNSKYRNTTATNGINRFLWNENNQGNAGNGNFAYIGTVRDVVEIKVYPFRIPYPSDGSADNGFKKITMLFEEFNAQAFCDVGRRFHIVFQVTIDANWIELIPFRNNDGIYKFEKPLTSINELTISFGSPTSIINFDPDRLNCTFLYGVITTLVFSEPHNLVTGDNISLVDFNTADPAADVSVINEMNQLYGHLISNVTPNTFTINVDTTTITPIIGLSIVCIFDSKTFQIPLQVTFVRPETIDSG